jgi:hypothetical protein
MSYILITAKLKEANESSYTNRSTGEVVSEVQLSLVVPSMRDRILCELPLEKAPKTDLLDRWELKESWRRLIFASRLSRTSAENEQAVIQVRVLSWARGRCVHMRSRTYSGAAP